MKLTTSISYIIFLLLIFSCSKLQRVTDIVVQPTARERYQREFKDADSLFNLWNNSFKAAKQNELSI